jgi:hypothetical protein
MVHFLALRFTPKFSLHYISISFHPSSFPLLYTFDCCNHPPVGWSAFLVPKFIVMFHYIILPFLPFPLLLHDLLYTLLIVVTVLLSDGPLVWPPDYFQVPITFHSIPIILLLFYYLFYTLLIVVAICCQMVHFLGP